MMDLFQPIPLNGDLNSSVSVTAGPVGYTFTQSDGAQIQNTGSMDNASSQGTANVVAGPSANAQGGGSTAVGQQAQVSGGNSTGIGQGTSVVGGASVVVGSQSNTSGSNDVVLGANASGGTGGNNVVIGKGASSRQGSSYLCTVIGAGSRASTANAVIVGASSNVTSTLGVVVGAGSMAGGTQDTIIGSESSTSSGGSNNTIIGTSNSITSSASNCVIVGVGSTISAGSALSFGQANTITAIGGMAIGNGITVSHQDAIVVGVAGGSSNAVQQLLYCVNGAAAPTGITVQGMVIHRSSLSSVYTSLVLSSATAASNNGGILSLSILDATECAIKSDRSGAGTYNPLNFYTSGTKQLALDTAGRLNFPTNTFIGGGNAAFGTGNCPATTTTSVNTWLRVVVGASTVGYIPIWV